MNIFDFIMGAINDPRSIAPIIVSGCATLLLASALAYAVIDTKRKKSGQSTNTQSEENNGLTTVDKSEYPGGQISVYFGTQTGTAEQFARQLEREGSRHGFLVHVIDLEDIQVEDLVDDARKDGDTGTARAVFISSTYGEGEAPDNSTQFAQDLADKGCTQILFEKAKGPSLEAPESCLVGLEFCVFGLGNRQYENFNAVARFYNHVLERLGGSRVLPIGLGDDDADLEADFENWKDNQLWPTLKKLYVKDPSVLEQRSKVAGIANQLPDCPYAIEYHDSSVTPQDMSLEQVHSSNRHFFTSVHVPVKVVRELQSPISNESTLHVELDISRAPGLSYQTADNLGILPMNKPEIVESVAECLEYNLDQVFSVKAVAHHDWHGALCPQPLTIRAYLTNFCDLTSAPRRSELKLLAMYASDPTDKQFLVRLASKEGKKEFKEKITDAFLGLADLLRLLPSIQIPLEHFVNMTPPMQTRFYTISSSSTVHPSTIHLTVAVTKAERKDGTFFEGACSGYLARGITNSAIRVHLRPSTFRLPADSNVPIIMIGPGTGVAPMRALLQERSHQRQSLGQAVGRNILYFGCRTSKEDFIYEDEFDNFQASGVLDSLYVAFSREQKEKVYVQHLLKANGCDTWKLVDEDGAYIYVCGGVKMGNDVSETLKGIFVSKGGMTAEAAKEYLVQLSQKGRFVQELWA
jgi:NADPH-ferrihemoprotein reductase